MPCKIPNHIFDVDQRTAERLSGQIIRRRRLNAALRIAVAVALAGVAICLAATRRAEDEGGKLLAEKSFYPVDSLPKDML